MRFSLLILPLSVQAVFDTTPEFAEWFLGPFTQTYPDQCSMGREREVTRTAYTFYLSTHQACKDGRRRRFKRQMSAPSWASLPSLPEASPAAASIIRNGVSVRITGDELLRLLNRLSAALASSSSSSSSTSPASLPSSKLPANIPRRLLEENVDLAHESDLLGLDEKLFAPAPLRNSRFVGLARSRPQRLRDLAKVAPDSDFSREEFVSSTPLPKAANPRRSASTGAASPVAWSGARMGPGEGEVAVRPTGTRLYDGLEPDECEVRADAAAESYLGSPTRYRLFKAVLGCAERVFYHTR